jgi:hypothetical protein
VDDLNLPFVSILGNKRKGMNSMSFIFDKMRKFYTNNEQIVQLNTKQASSYASNPNKPELTNKVTT